MKKHDDIAFIVYKYYSNGLLNDIVDLLSEDKEFDKNKFIKIAKGGLPRK